VIKYPNPTLQFIGPPGAGKTAILEGLASRIVSKEVPEVFPLIRCCDIRYAYVVHQSLQNKRVLPLDLSAIMAGSGIRRQFEEKSKAFIRDIEKRWVPTASVDKKDLTHRVVVSSVYR
jgi:ATP-dependent Clp protease ATP-binding subunit ClpB